MSNSRDIRLEDLMRRSKASSTVATVLGDGAAEVAQASAEPDGCPSPAEQIANAMQFGADMVTKYSNACKELARLKASAAPVAPLTRQQIAQGFKSYSQYAYGAFEDGVRFAEKSHGITTIDRAAATPKDPA